MIYPLIAKLDTQLRIVISPTEKQSLILRFLASGNLFTFFTKHRKCLLKSFLIKGLLPIVIDINIYHYYNLTKKLDTFDFQEADFARKLKDEKQYLEEGAKLSNQEGQDLERRIREMQEIKNKIGRKVNAKAQTMFEHEEKQYNDIRKKQNIVENDKRKMLAVMLELDEKKKQSLKLAFDQVSKDFGSIFSTLLPGASSKLTAPFGMTILEGVEIKVSLGGVWKDNLTELSGGQRSLAALSLILAMLLFKPAPLYILDEVDAALDLSHTQNIGSMLKSHFKKSQFIIVSLKDGMFNNANVLFRTKFVDGVSTVSRTTNKS
ncbi:hypothetical protein HHI36_001921 [Cryptolaemus montrouzieri]|uniref:RecF/RecN/SMC N-terminal domain-containing protein n=1 Tax=Cryptolaemus montrouzieri TaxID=559131 RepID=A0ABD2PAC9_9CUCU